MIRWFVFGSLNVSIYFGNTDLRLVQNFALETYHRYYYMRTHVRERVCKTFINNIYICGLLVHPAGSSINSAICEEISKFSPNVSQWEGYFSCSFSVEYPQISKSSEIYSLSGQCSSDVQLVAFNYIQILKDNFSKNQRNLWIFQTMCFLEISKFWLMITNQFNPVSTSLYSQ